MSSIETFKLPSGRSVSSCRKDARKLQREKSISLHQALDIVAQTNGVEMPWHKAIANIKIQLVFQGQGITHYMTEADIKVILVSYPLLTHFGMGLYKGRKRTQDEYAAEFKEQRNLLISAVDECNKACMYLQHVEKRKTINGNLDSYSFKHKVERYSRLRPNVEDNYVANGSFIAAAIFMGFDIDHLEERANICINFSSKSCIFEYEKLHAMSISGRLTGAKQQRISSLKETLGL